MKALSINSTGEILVISPVMDFTSEGNTTLNTIAANDIVQNID